MIPRWCASSRDSPTTSSGERERGYCAATGGSWRAPYQRPSMAQDMAKGRRTEIELMNGYIASEGARIGVAAPTHEMLTRQVLRVERGELQPRPENVLANA